MNKDPVLFSGPLRDSVDPFQEYSDDEIWTALEQTRLANYVRSLPESLQHTLAEGGSNLSVGQRQLVSLARAMLRKTRISVADESTAALDPESDQAVREAIQTNFQGSTILHIAHRLDSVRNADRILVLEDGRVQNFETPEKLLADSNSLVIIHSILYCILS